MEMCPCLLRWEMKQCSAPEAGQLLRCAFYSPPGFPSLCRQCPLCTISLRCYLERMGEQSEGESVIKQTTEPRSPRCQPLFSTVFFNFSSLLNILCKLLQTSHAAPVFLKQRRCMAGWLWWHWSSQWSRCLIKGAALGMQWYPAP